MNVQKFLQKSGVPFRFIERKDTLATLSEMGMIPGTGPQLAKSVLLRTETDYVLVVLPMTHRIDLMRVREALAVEEGQIADDSELICQCGLHNHRLLHPFGSQFGLKTVIDQSLAFQNTFAFSGFSDRFCICMRGSDYRSLENPIVGAFAEPVS